MLIPFQLTAGQVDDSHYLSALAHIFQEAGVLYGMHLG